MGLALPQRRSAGQYVGAVRSGNLLFVSGAGPLLRRFVKLWGYVNSAPGFS